MSAGAFLLHGLRVAVDGDAAGPALALLAGFPPAGPGPVDLAIALGSVAERTVPDPDARPVFFHGRVRARERGGAVVLHDGASSLAVSADGRRIDGRVHPESLAYGGHAFAHVALLLALVVALRHRGLFHVHAAALVAPAGRCLLVPGGAGAGKTTLTLALASRGCAFLGDDAVFLAAGGDGPRVLAFPRDFHVAERSAAAFPGLSLHGGGTAPNGKRFVDAGRVFPGRALLETAAPDLLLFPEVARGPATEVLPISGAEAVGAMVEACALVVVDAMPRVPEQLDLLRRVADGARAFRVRLGADLLAEPERVAGGILAVAGAR